MNLDHTQLRHPVASGVRFDGRQRKGRQIMAMRTLRIPSRALPQIVGSFTHQGGGAESRLLGDESGNLVGDENGNLIGV